MIEEWKLILLIIKTSVNMIVVHLKSIMALMKLKKAIILFTALIPRISPFSPFINRITG